jgi:hypothetical protein
MWRVEAKIKKGIKYEKYGREDRKDKKKYPILEQ